MVNILIISTNRIVFDEINLAFPNSAYNFEYVDSWETAIDYLDSEIPDSVFLIDKELEIITKLLKSLALEYNNENMPIICFTEKISKEEKLKLFQNGAFDIINFPILKDELNMLISKHCSSFQTPKNEISAGMQGRLEDFSVIDLIETLEEGNKSAILKLGRNDFTGQIVFQEGQIHTAQLGKFSGIDAILNLVGWIRGDFVVELTDQLIEKNIELDNQQILIESIGRIDEKSAFLKQLPPIDDILLISPEIDMHKIDNKDLKFFKFFQGGNTIYQFLINFSLDELVLLAIILDFFQKNMLLTCEQFDAFTTEYEAEVAQSGFKGIINRFFKKEKNKSRQVEMRKRDKTEIIDLNSENKIRESVLLIDPVILNEFKVKITEL